MSTLTPNAASQGSGVGPDLEQTRIDLAAALRWADRLGFSEGVDNHFSVALPFEDSVTRGSRFLLNPYGWHWSEITASSLVLCDEEGSVLDGDNSVENTAFFIHSRLHVNVPRATVVLHTHMPYTTSLTLLEEGRLEMCEQNALMFHERIAYDDDYNGFALDAAEGDRMARKLGDKTVLFLASHGVIVTAPTVAEAFTDLYYLERASMFQVLAQSSGRELRRIEPAVVEKTRQQAVQELPRLADRYFSALKRILDKEEPEYRE